MSILRAKIRTYIGLGLGLQHNPDSGLEETKGFEAYDDTSLRRSWAMEAAFSLATIFLEN